MIGKDMRKLEISKIIDKIIGLSVQIRKKLTWPLILNCALFLLFVGSVIFLTVKYSPIITNMITNPESFRHWLLQYGWASVFIYMFFMMLHIIIVIIPGEFVQIAGGYLYGAFFGTVYSMIGLIAGMMLVFFASRLFGYPLIKRLIPEKNLEKFKFIINNEKSEIAIFVLFLIPGIPKDALVYIAGVTPIKTLNFFIISITARFPGILGSVLIGMNLKNENYTAAIIISIIALLLFLTGVFARNKVINKLHQLSKRSKHADK
jgi:uncharacterized membrane protein YdjX (TVP38/TMEM64 family)